MKTVGFLLSLAIGILLFCPDFALLYAGIIYCFLLSAIGTAIGVSTIAKHVSGTSIKHPRVGTKSILGTVVCEANFLSGIISCVLALNSANSVKTVQGQYILFCSSAFVGICSLYSSIATGTICAVVSLMDGRDEKLFFRLVVLEVIPASVGLIGFILGIVMNSKAN